MTSQFVTHQAIFFLRSRADVVDHFPVARCTFLIADDHDVRQLASHETSDQIPGLKCLCGKGEREFEILSLEVFLEVGHASMIDVFVCCFQTPIFRIDSKGALHVLMHFFLQIDAVLAHGTNHHIRANAAFDR